MKKTLLMSALFGITVSLSANSTHMNLAYTVKTALLGTGTTGSLALSFTNLYATGRGFYTQLNPYYGLTVSADETANFNDSGEFLLGANTIIGYGFDINSGNFGILLGIGAFLDSFILYHKGQEGTIEPVLDIDKSVFNLSVGAGFAANVYLRPGDGNFYTNFGFRLAWAPIYLFEDSLMNVRLEQASMHAGFGLGWIY